MRFSYIVAGLAAFASSIIAAPSPNPDDLFDIEKRNCPRYDLPVSVDLGDLYLGSGNNKSNQLERLFEEVIALLVGEYPKCDKNHIKLVCKGKDYKEKRNDPPQCPDKYPYKECHIECYGKNYC